MHAFIGQFPITSSSELAFQGTRGPEESVGDRITVPGTFDTIPELAPGASMPYVDRIPVDVLGRRRARRLLVRGARARHQLRRSRRCRRRAGPDVPPVRPAAGPRPTDRHGAGPARPAPGPARRRRHPQRRRGLGRHPERGRSALVGPGLRARRGRTARSPGSSTRPSRTPPASSPTATRPAPWSPATTRAPASARSPRRRRRTPPTAGRARPRPRSRRPPARTLPPWRCRGWRSSTWPSRASRSWPCRGATSTWRPPRSGTPPSTRTPARARARCSASARPR